MSAYLVHSDTIDLLIAAAVVVKFGRPHVCATLQTNMLVFFTGRA